MGNQMQSVRHVHHSYMVTYLLHSSHAGKLNWIWCFQPGETVLQANTSSPSQVRKMQVQSGTYFYQNNLSTLVNWILVFALTATVAVYPIQVCSQSTSAVGC